MGLTAFGFGQLESHGWAAPFTPDDDQFGYHQCFGVLVEAGATDATDVADTAVAGEMVPLELAELIVSAELLLTAADAATWPMAEAEGSTGAGTGAGAAEQADKIKAAPTDATICSLIPCTISPV